MTRINTTLLKKHKSSFDNVRSTFKSSSYSTFSSSYINSCSDSTVIRMKSKLKSLYDAIDKGYNNINGWWSSYNNDVDSLERALSSDGTSNNISKSSIRNYVNSNLPELEGYKPPFSDTFNLNFDNTSSIQNMNNVLDSINLSFTSNSDNNFYVDNSTKSWWQDKATSFKDKALNFFSNVGAKVSDCYESVTETITNAKDDFVDWVKEDALPYINKCYNNWESANDLVGSSSCKMGATSTLAAVSLGEGFLKFGEKMLDFATIAGAAMNTEVTTNLDNYTLIHSALTTGEAKYGTATEDMWKSTQSFVAKNYVNSWYDDFYENNKIGQYIKENAMGFDTVRTVSSGLGELGGNIALSVLTLGGSGATSLATNMSNVMVTNAFSAGFGNGAENAWANGASLEEGLTTATVNGSWEAFQWWIGTKIGGWNPFKGSNTSSKLMNILLRVGADAIDGGVEGFAQPAISTIYQDGYYDADGNYIEFTDKDNWWKRYTELFDDTGGWINVGLQTAIGAGGSLIGEIGEFNKILKDQKTTVDLPENINVKPVDVIVDKQPKLTLDDLKYKKQGIVSTIISMFESSVNRYTYSDTNLFDGLNDNILGKGLYHFTDAADKILESGYIKASGESYIGPLGYLGPSYGNPKTFFFNGIPEVGAFATNLDSIPLKTTAVKVIPDVDVVDSPSLKVRNLDDGAIIYDGRFDLSNGKTSKEYFCLVKENNELLYKPVSQEFFNNYENTSEGRILQQFLNDKRNIQSIKDDYLVGLSVRNANAKVQSGSFTSVALGNLNNSTTVLDNIMEQMGNTSGRRNLLLFAANGNIDRIPLEFRDAIKDIPAQDIRNYFEIENTKIGPQFFGETKVNAESILDNLSEQQIKDAFKEADVPKKIEYLKTLSKEKGSELFKDLSVEEVNIIFEKSHSNEVKKKLFEYMSPEQVKSVFYDLDEFDKGSLLELMSIEQIKDVIENVDINELKRSLVFASDQLRVKLVTTDVPELIKILVDTSPGNYARLLENLVDNGISIDKVLELSDLKNTGFAFLEMSPKTAIKVISNIKDPNILKNTIDAINNVDTQSLKKLIIWSSGDNISGKELLKYINNDKLMDCLKIIDVDSAIYVIRSLDVDRINEIGNKLGSSVSSSIRITKNGYYDANGKYIKFIDKFTKKYGDFIDGTGGSLISKLPKFDEWCKKLNTIVPLPKTITSKTGVDFNVKKLVDIIKSEEKLTAILDFNSTDIRKLDCAYALKQIIELADEHNVDLKVNRETLVQIDNFIEVLSVEYNKYSDYSFEGVMSVPSYRKLCEEFLNLAPNAEIKSKLESILFKGGYKDFCVSSKIARNNVNFEVNKRLDLASLLITNPETFDVLVENNINVFHGTNANALPSILKYGLNSGAESEKMGIYVSTGEKWSRGFSGGQRDFVSFTDVLSVASDYSQLTPESGSEQLSFSVIIGTTKDDALKAGTCGVISSLPEIGVKNKLPLENIKVVAVPSDKVDFVKKLVGDDSIIVVAMDEPNYEPLYYRDEFYHLKINSQNIKNTKLFNFEEIKNMMFGRTLSDVKMKFEQIKNLLSGGK